MDDGHATDAGSRPVVFYDGECGLCSRFVDFCLNHDRRQLLHYAPLQGETAESRLPAEFRQLDTVVFGEGDRLLVRSSAVVAVLKKLGGVWRAAAAALWLVPKPLRDIGYRLVAANRSRLPGLNQTCRLPTAEESARLLP